MGGVAVVTRAADVAECPFLALETSAKAASLAEIDRHAPGLRKLPDDRSTPRKHHRRASGSPRTTPWIFDWNEVFTCDRRWRAMADNRRETRNTEFSPDRHETRLGAFRRLAVFASLLSVRQRGACFKVPGSGVCAWCSVLGQCRWPDTCATCDAIVTSSRQLGSAGFSMAHVQPSCHAVLAIGFVRCRLLLCWHCSVPPSCQACFSLSTLGPSRSTLLTHAACSDFYLLDPVAQGIRLA